MSSSYFNTYTDPSTNLQTQTELAVIIPTILRPQLRTALSSVFAQDLPGPVQILIGVDTPPAAPGLLDELCRSRPSNCTVQVFYPGYSTSFRHGGLSPSADGGDLRCILSFLANSRYLAYLDDDNWWRPDHLRRLREALVNADWAYAQRWFVHPETDRPICVDEWESVGVGRGIFKDTLNGSVDTNCLMLNKATCASVLPFWSRPYPPDQTGLTADRSVFEKLRQRFRGARVPDPTVYYRLNPNDAMHPYRLQQFGALYERAALRT